MGRENDLARADVQYFEPWKYGQFCTCKKRR